MMIHPCTQLFSKGEGLPLIPGSNIGYVLPAPKRNERGQIKVDGEYLDENQLNQPLREVCWEERHYDFSFWVESREPQQ